MFEEEKKKEKMEDNQQQQQQQQQQQHPSSNTNTNNTTSPPSHGSNKTNSEPVRSRWTPKPEQILILESIFNSGMVNPHKDETVRIRKLLEEFGAVADANVFYWFQNRRSRSRRRQRQMQAANNLLNKDQAPNRSPPTMNTFNHSSIQFEPTSSSSSSSTSSSSCFDPSNSLSFLIGDGGSVGVGVGGSSSSSSSSVGGRGGLGIGIGNCGEDGSFYSISNQMGLTEMEQCHNVSSMLCSSSNMNYQPQPAGFITVFINGVPTEVPNGSLDMRNMFGQDVMLVHSSGMPVPFNEYGFSLHSLQMGESYFLVSRSI